MTPNSQKYILPIEHAQALVNENSPAYVAGGFQVVMSLLEMNQRFWKHSKPAKELHGEIMIKTYLREQKVCFRPGYTANLVSSWIPALDNGNVEQALKKGGAKVADIGCGHGVSTILMAKAYPNSKFYGFDNHPASIEYARKKAREEGLGEDRIQFEVASSTNYSVS